ncbi:MAG TPA: D-2-hydroxyacid dehydrogenase family protein [Methylomirabilota bacterium]|nr:D-2-hydroxyacid dehydrogenase family protein [Methylomirabilota bacterium]
MPLRGEAPVKRVAILDDYQGEVLALADWKRLEDRASIDVFRDTLKAEDELVARLKPYEIVVPIRERTRFPGSLLERLPSLRLLALTGKNSGHVDVAAATASGILVADTEGSGPAAIEHSIALLMALVRRIPQDDRAVREGRWQTGFGLELAGKTLGILGLGRIGGRVAAFGKFLGMRVVAWGPTLTDERAKAAGVERLGLDALFGESDVVSVHLRLSDKTRGVVGARQLEAMKPTAYLVNTARGPLVDEAALARVLRERRIAGAGLDVFDEEPLPKGHPFLGLDNLVMTPHTGYVTREAYRAFFAGVVDNVDAYLRGEIPARCLNPDAREKRP